MRWCWRIVFTAMFLSLDYLYVPANDIEASVRYYTEQLGGELVWKIHAFETWVAAIRLSSTGPMVLLAEHLEGDTPILIYRVERLEIPSLRYARGAGRRKVVPSKFRMALATPFATQQVSGWPFYENQRPEVDQAFAGRIDSEN